MPALTILLGALCVPFDDPENIVCTIPTHTALVGAVCGGRVRIELRPELHAYRAVCIPTHSKYICKCGRHELCHLKLNEGNFDPLNNVGIDQVSKKMAW